MRTTPDTPRRTQLPVLGRTRASAAAAPAQGAVSAGARLAVVTLGCDKNTVDSERVLGRLQGAGARIAAVADGAEVVVVNTCGFIDVAKEESIETILEAVRAKGRGELRAVVAMGCLVERYKDDLVREIPEVDLFLGLTEIDRLVPELRARGLLPDPAAVPLMERPLRLLSTETPHTSYLKISEGCDHGCAFCAIPLMRGKHRSTPVERLVAEARELEARGVVELNLISQDNTWYGRDLRRGVGAPDTEFFVGQPFQGGARVRRGTAAGWGAGRRDPSAPLLPDLLRALLDATSIPWFRSFYMYPSGIARELVELLAREPRLLPYLDMPIQHGADHVLKLMRRPERRATILERVGWLRAAIPHLTLRTTVIVGFPGEREEDFESLLELLEEVRFERVGAFSYSAEEDTPAATMPDQVPAGVRRERLERVLELQATISLEKNEALVGREVSVLVDRIEQDGAIGRTEGQAYDVDGVVQLPGARLRPGTFARARILSALDHDLVAEPVDGGVAS